MNWKSYDPVVYNDIEYGSKNVEFMKILDLPKYQDNEFEVVMGGKECKEAVRFLKASGWSVVDKLKITKRLKSYTEYIYQSKAELSVAKNGYVKGKTGWFGDRSACYLASGKPVVLQERISRQNKGFL